MSQRAKTLAAARGGFWLPHQRTERRRAVLLTMTLTAFGMPIVAPLGRPLGRRHADGRAHFELI